MSELSGSYPVSLSLSLASAKASLFLFVQKKEEDTTLF